MTASDTWATRLARCRCQEPHIDPTICPAYAPATAAAYDPGYGQPRHTDPDHHCTACDAARDPRAVPVPAALLRDPAKPWIERDYDGAELEVAWRDPGEVHYHADTGNLAWPGPATADCHAPIEPAAEIDPATLEVIAWLSRVDAWREAARFAATHYDSAGGREAMRALVEWIVGVVEEPQTFTQALTKASVARVDWGAVVGAMRPAGEEVPA